MAGEAAAASRASWGRTSREPSILPRRQGRSRELEYLREAYSAMASGKIRIGLEGRVPGKWWGWGDEGKTYHLPDPERFWAYIHRRLGPTEAGSRLDSLERVQLRASRLSAGLLTALARIVGEGGLSTESPDRAARSLGKGYKDLVRIRQGQVPNPSDVVVWPRTEEQVTAVVELAAREGIAVIPFGGGTSVVGGVEPAGEGPFLTLDLGEMTRVVRIDRQSATATVRAGIAGPDLERQLNAAGFTLGHFPQSFEYSTVGGWIATRSAGQKSTLYGKIEERVQGLRLAYPGGLLTTPATPAAAAGPDLVQLIVGSEGALGVITEANLRLAPLPPHQDYRGYLFHGFGEGVAAARELMQSGLKPAVLRLSDEAETESAMALRSMPQGLAAVRERAGRWYLARRGLFLESASIMILGFEGDEAVVRHQWAEARPVLRRLGGQSLGRGPGRTWERSRYDAPYLRDLLLDDGIMVDTLETATTWDRYLSLYGAVREALGNALGERGAVMAHLSHSYSDGGSIYYTFLAPQERGGELEQWERAKVAATEAIVRRGGALSHHHGIGSDHRVWMEPYLGPSGVRWLAALKSTLDPQGVMNPGKLVPELSTEAGRPAAGAGGAHA
jgi:alkyldihydroxyacetonephosphate synthase